MQRRSRLLRAVLGASAAVLAVALAGCASTTADPGFPPQQPGGFPSDVTARLTAAVTDAIGQSGGSAGIVGVWAPWAGSWTTAIGTTTRGGSTPVTPSMTFRIGQLTTPMTCTVLLELVDDGTVQLDDPVSKWLPGLVGVGGVTLRELCQNTSGIGDYAAQLHGEFLANPTRYWPPLELASDGIATARTGSPGARYAPSQTNAVLVGMALQNATDSNWQQLYSSRVFSRLDMSASTLPDNGVLTVPGEHPAGYAAALDAAGAPLCDQVREVTALSPSMGWTAAGVVSNVPDLKAFAQALAGGSLLSSRSADAQNTTVGAGSSWLGYGLGVQVVGPLRGGAAAVPGYLTAMYADPSSGLTIVAAVNNSTPGAGFAQGLAQRLASIVSKVPAVKKGAKAVAALPWSEDQAVAAMKAAAPCPTPAAK
ncbi:beta-lactamase family protein [Leifsonia shinshuensis]|uniref:serine hydrolase domain-containing protein n=1 Tax=Leifsonia shinshuensis TaxID=150026 RepID=UPI001F5086B7|nr:serine hydrolase domain-containing protein [Leifsonia shinshuensis]MCI0156914.1 beta-lactamase family protein [Leifsonia shinshuensis]